MFDLRAGLDPGTREGGGTEVISSLCPECLAPVTGYLTETSGGAVLEKTCEKHGSFRAIVSTDVESYRMLREMPRKVTFPPSRRGIVENGCPNDCGLCPSHDQHTCLAILEITSRCDLRCPVCLASASPPGRDLPAAVVETALKSFLEKEGAAAPLQLSGGEPTLHPDLTQIVEKASSLGFGRIEIDTNGLGLGRDPALACRLRGAGLSGIYLQMDGLRPAVFEAIRGKDLLPQKLKAIENARAAGLQVVLSVTLVPGVNEDSLWDLVDFGVHNELTGVNFQAIALSGRYPEQLSGRVGRLTLGHFLGCLEQQSGGVLQRSDLTPVPCSDPRCGAMAYVLVRDGKPIPLGRVVEEKLLFDHVAQMSDWDQLISALDLSPPPACGCGASCGQASMDLGKELIGAEFFSIGYHGMMDAYTFDRERAQRCCVHNLLPDGRLIPFCLYNIKHRQVLS
ncbi:MAG: radical SAM protein [Deltaproteobacteria bacterium]|nr:radical SAM protein [Deltaproteobacteria bacterium]